MIFDVGAADRDSSRRFRVFLDEQEIKSVFYVDTEKGIVRTYDVLDRGDVAIPCQDYDGPIGADWIAVEGGVFWKEIHGDRLRVEEIVSSRSIVNVATGYYVKGGERLLRAFQPEQIRSWVGLPKGWLAHEQKPYAFKAYALKEASGNAETLLWCDACIVPGPRKLDDLWEKIERDGYWIADNGYTNYEWTADAAYPALFPDANIHRARDLNRGIPHVVATAFGISLAHPIGRAILDEYYRLASETDAFCGPWINKDYQYQEGDLRNFTFQHCASCGPSDVRGHRHDQTALSVIAWRLGCQLSNCPEWFAYKGGETEETCLVADGSY